MSPGKLSLENIIILSYFLWVRYPFSNGLHQMQRYQMPSSKSKVINSRHRKKIDVLNFQSLHHFVTLPSWQSRTHAHEDVNAHALWWWRAFFLWWMCVCLGLIFHRLFSQASWDFSPIVKKKKNPLQSMGSAIFLLPISGCQRGLLAHSRGCAGGVWKTSKGKFNFRRQGCGVGLRWGVSKNRTVSWKVF